MTLSAMLKLLSNKLMTRMIMALFRNRHFYSDYLTPSKASSAVKEMAFFGEPYWLLFFLIFIRVSCLQQSLKSLLLKPIYPCCTLLENERIWKSRHEYSFCVSPDLKVVAHFWKMKEFGSQDMSTVSAYLQT